MRLDQAIEKYLEYTKTEQSHESWRRDKRLLGYFQDLWTGEIEHLKIGDILDCASKLDVSDDVRNRFKTSCKKFLDYCNIREITDIKTDLIKTKYVHDQSFKGTIISPEDYKKIDLILQEKSKTSKKWTRYQAVFRMLYSTGLRRQEICKIPMDTFDLSSKTFIVKTKNKKSYTVDFDCDISKYINSWHPNRTLFELSGNSVYEIVKECGKLIGISITTHDTRRTFGTTLLDNGATPAEASKLMRQESINSIDPYYQFKERKKKYQKYWGISKIFDFVFSFKKLGIKIEIYKKR